MSYKVKEHKKKVFKLNKALYGLKQAPRTWYNSIDDYFLKNRFVKCPYEYVVYIIRASTYKQLNELVDQFRNSRLVKLA